MRARRSQSWTWWRVSNPDRPMRSSLTAKPSTTSSSWRVRRVPRSKKCASASWATASLSNVSMKPRLSTSQTSSAGCQRNTRDLLFKIKNVIRTCMLCRPTSSSNAQLRSTCAGFRATGSFCLCWGRSSRISAFKLPAWLLWCAGTASLSSASLYYFAFRSLVAAKSLLDELAALAAAASKTNSWICHRDGSRWCQQGQAAALVCNFHYDSHSLRPSQCSAFTANYNCGRLVRLIFAFLSGDLCTNYQVLYPAAKLEACSSAWQRLKSGAGRGSSRLRWCLAIGALSAHHSTSTSADRDSCSSRCY